MSPQYLHQLSAFLAETGYDNLPTSVAQHARLVLMDTIGVILGGSQEREMQELTKQATELRGGQTATILGRGFPQADPAWAALINGTAGIFLELDEGHRPTGHPAIHIVPAALAMAEHLHSSGRELIAAIVLGYELPARISAACRLKKGIHPHGHWGGVGAAAACAKLMHFDIAGMKEALRVAASLPLASSWLPCYEGATVRNIYAGHAGHVGILTCLLVKSGFTGLQDGLAETFGAILAQDYDPAKLIDGLGVPFKIADNYFKFHACCAANHPVLDALQQVLAQGPLSPGEISRIEVSTLDFYASIVDKQHPKNQLAAKFSLPFAVAAGIVRGTTSVESFRQEVVLDSQIQSLAEKVIIKEDPALTQRWPEDAPGRVVVYLKDGSSLIGSCNNPRGSFRNPCSQEELEDKFLTLSAAVLGYDGAREAIKAIIEVESYDDVAMLTGRLRYLSP